jgi:hypothetical protein
MFEPLLFLLALAGNQAADPLAPAREGKIQCIGPNKEKKTCMGTVTYVVRPDGSYDSTVTAMVAPQPLITMQTKTSGKVENGLVCGVVRKSEYEAATFQMDGKPAEQAMSDAIRAQVLGAVSALDGKNGCSRERADGEVSTLDVTVDGVARPELTQKAIWVKPDEGYKIGL